MELKVWVEGIQRIVCGVTENTTCQDVVYALAHATGKTGRFTLNERWRSNERLLAPQDHPLKVLMKWGEYSNDVQFILQRSQLDDSKYSNSSSQPKQKSGTADPLHNFTPTSPLPLDEFSTKTPDRNKDIRKSLTFSGGSHLPGITEHRRSENIGIVKGIQKKELELEAKESKQMKIEDEEMSLSSNKSEISSSSSSQIPQPTFKREAPPYRDPPGPNTGTHSPHQRVLPPYRDPPPPTQSPNRSTPTTGNTSPLRSTPTTGSNSPNPYKNVSTSTNNKMIKPKRNLMKEFHTPVTGSNSHSENESYKEMIICNSQYRDLVRLVNYQREKISAQQSELTKFDAEIVYWETKAREQQRQLEFITQEKVRMESTSKQNEDQLRILAHAEEEYEIVRQQEKTLKSEISLLRSKLANCETELLQCKNKIRLLFEELQLEKRNAVRETDERQHLERSLLSEVEKLQVEVEQARQATEISAQCSENLKREVSMLESVIMERKHQLEQLVAEMKEANLQSLAIAPPEELKHIFEGPYKPGITRKMIGSPRQLENAVPTSKNPHGVWV